MKFCPKCGKLMIPRRENSRIVLVCPQCKNSIEVTRSVEVGYRVKHEVEEEKRTKMAVVTGAERKLTEEERQLLEDYYKVFLETYMESEETSSEEGSE